MKKFELKSKSDLKILLIEHFGTSDLSNVAQRISDFHLDQKHKIGSGGFGVLAYRMDTKKGEKDMYPFYKYEMLPDGIVDVTIYDVVLENSKELSDYLLDIMNLIKSDAVSKNAVITYKQENNENGD
jgi:hypothetical protein